MYNLLKYELFRLKKNKSLRVILILGFLVAFLQPVTYKAMHSVFEDERAKLEETQIVTDDGTVLSADGMTEEEEKEYSAGLSIMSSAKWYQKDFKPNLYDFYVSIVTGMFPALLLVIFAINFVAQEFSTGFIKSIGAYVKMSQLYLVNMLMIIIGVVLMNVVTLVATAISSQVVCGFLIWGSIGTLLKYMLYSSFLTISFLAVPVVLYYIIRSGTLPMVLGILETVLGTLVCGGVANLLMHEYMNVSEDFSLAEYFSVYHLKMSEFEFAKKAVENPIIFAIIGLVVCSVASMYVLKKKDV